MAVLYHWRACITGDHTHDADVQCYCLVSAEMFGESLSQLGERNTVQDRLRRLGERNTVQDRSRQVGERNTV